MKITTLRGKIVFYVPIVNTVERLQVRYSFNICCHYFQIKVDIAGVQDEKYDDSNVLALPSKKRKAKVKEKEHTHVKKLSKKQRKLLEKVLERKQKKAKVIKSTHQISIAMGSQIHSSLNFLFG